MNDPQKIAKANQIAIEAFKASAPEIEVLDCRTEFFDGGMQIGTSMSLFINGEKMTHVRRARLTFSQQWEIGARGNGRALATWAKKRLDHEL